jgi:hypothetical protein
MLQYLPGYYQSSVAALYAGSALFGAGTSGGTLLGAEPDGMAIDCTAATPDMLIRDNTTTLNYSGHPFSQGPLGNAGKLSFTGASLRMKYNSSGTLEFAGHNLVTQSQTLDNAGWNKVSTTVVADQAVAPDGTTTMDLVYPTTTGAARYITRGANAAGPYRMSVYAKAAGLSYVYFFTPDQGAISAYFNVSAGTVGTTRAGHTATIESIGNGVYRCTVSASIEFGSGDLLIGVADADNSITATTNGTNGVYIWGVQYQRTPCSDTTYYPTVASAVYAPRIDYNPATLAARGLLVEEARTNLCLQSNDFTNASWTKSNMTTAKTATGPDAVANSASTLTATAGNATASQAITSASAARVTSMFVKRRTGTGNIDMTQNGGTLWTTITVTADWTRVEIAAATITDPTVGIRIVTSGDAVDIGYFQHEVGSFVTSAIPTTSASVTRAVDAVSIATSLFPYSATVGTLYASCMFMSVAALARALNLDDGTANERVTLGISAAAAGLLNVVDGGTEQAGASGITSGTFVALTAAKIAASWAANDLAVTKDAAAPTTDTSATLPTMTTLRLGSGPSAAAPINGWLRQVVHLPRAMSDAELQTLTA